MTPLEITLSIILYIILTLLSYIPFKRFADNEISHYPKSQLVFMPYMWVIYFIIAIFTGFSIMYTKTEDNGNNKE